MRVFNACAATAVLLACTPDLDVASAPQISCSRSADCPVDFVCLPTAGICRRPEAECVATVESGFDTASDGTPCGIDGASICLRGVCEAPRCGDGVLSAMEDCDLGPGNSDTPDNGCRSDCSMQRCGDGVRDSGEGCDDGNATDADGCDTNCTLTACGNGVMAAPEGCDDGNLNDGDGCDSNCQPTGCGNGVRTGIEECDDGDPAVDCLWGMMACLQCDGSCRAVPGAVHFCGDGVPDSPDEQCDDGDTDEADGCTSGCVRNDVCGDGRVQGEFEQCDAGMSPGNGCDANCRLEPGRGCTMSPSVCFPITFVHASATGAADGTSWADAYPRLQDALAIAAAGDEIWVAEGSYRPDQGGGETPGDRQASFWLVEGATLVGGFAGTEGTRELRDPLAHPTVLDGDLAGDDGPAFANRDDNAFHVVRSMGNTAAAVLDGFIVRGGDADASGGSDGDGGGIWIGGSSPTIRNCLITDNRALRGGGISSETYSMVTSSPTIEDNDLDGNQVIGNGGGMWMDEGSPVVARTTFRRNVSQLGGGLALFDVSTTIDTCTFSDNDGIDGGGGLYMTGMPDVDVVDSLFDGNTSLGGGGGINCSSSFMLLTVVRTVITSNSASDGGGILCWLGQCVIRDSTIARNAGNEGAGISARSGNSLTVESSTVEENRGTAGGGILSWGFAATDIVDVRVVGNTGQRGAGLFLREGTITVTDSWIADNSAAGNGGGIRVSNSGDVVVQNTVLVGNWARFYGGGVNVDGASPVDATFVNCTIAGNTTLGSGGGFENRDDLTVTNSIIWGNAAGTMPSINPGSGTTTVDYSCVEGGFAGTGNVAVDPVFADPVARDFRLQTTSPVIDAGDATATSTTTDLDGAPRKVDDPATADTGNATPPIDLGAYELQP